MWCDFHHFLTVWETLLHVDGQTETYQGRLFICNSSFLKTENVSCEYYTSFNDFTLTHKITATATTHKSVNYDVVLWLWTF